METNKLAMYLLDRSNRKKIRLSYYFILIFLILFSILTDVNVKEDNEYDDMKHIALYIYEYGDTPSNYVPKSESNTLEGDELYLYSTFYNRESLLPLEDTYQEVYINAFSGDAGSERLVYSEETVYYTSDHYASFEIVTVNEILLPHRILTTVSIVLFLTYPSMIIILRYGRKTLASGEIKEDFKQDFDDVKQSYKNFINKYKKDKTA